MSSLRRFWALAAVLLLALGAAALAGAIARQVMLARVETQGRQDLRLRQALLASEIARFRLLPRALADDRDLVAAAQTPAPAARAALNRKLEALAREFGAAAIYVIDRGGFAFGASNWRQAQSFIGRDYNFRPYFRQALQSGQAQQFALGTASHKAGLYLATRAAGGAAVVVVKLEFDGIESAWRAAPGITFVTDPQGVVLVASRPDWRFAATAPLAPPVRQAEQQSLGVPALPPPPFARPSAGLLVPVGTATPHLLVQSARDAAGWRLNLALPLAGTVDPAVRVAQGTTALIVLLLCAVAAALVERARQRRRRTAQLESAVAQATAELRSEIQERTAAEARAATLREGLRQANRLATLGQVTASVAHETAQPVAAIRNYAASAALLLDRGESAEARENLAAITRLADRIGAITQHLRGFARKGSRGESAIVLAEALDGARLILKEQLSRVSLALPPLDPALRVRAEKTRLEQVLVIILQNAIEALAGVPDAAITIAVAETPTTLDLTIADNGPGLDPEIAARLFTPFATSRPMGLGLGLVIAKDIVEEFSGSLVLVPSAQGAAFRVTLVRAA
ncbi:ATP-binding protein [Novosphingobium sp. SG720]|uniref:sensor histidine kinase n=1 Tax=Novosphingobium sp. SG720 TaxID=2586998 RepID=UPI0014477B53|nr:ATP-binding protein [Novosphingobium sp. SG720]NKJ44039.1 two-component system C4-dicarboxylate transport sensor histidine kinase DctB [Novosphingobium sp. SG720]